MLKYFKYITVLACFSIILLAFGTTTDAASFKGTFVNATYTETELADGTIVKKLNGITIKNNVGKTTTLSIDESAKFYVNNTYTSINAFKSGMNVEAKVNLRKVNELYGTSNVNQGQIAAKSKQESGSVTKVDPYGSYIKVKLDDDGIEKTYYLNNETNFVKGNNSVDVSSLYEGDRVHLKFSSTTTPIVAEVEIVTTGILVHNIYKGNLQSINTSSNKMTVRNTQTLKNWSFGTSYNQLNTFTFTNNTTIYVGNKQITKNELQNYKTSNVYFVTVDELGKEIIKKIIVTKNTELTYFEPMTSVNVSSKLINLKNSGKVKFHGGSILIRNGRLIEPSTLVSSGTAFVVTDGGTYDQFAHIINVTNDSFDVPNLQNHELYFGQIKSVNGYSVTVGDLLKIDDNNWKSTSGLKDFSFSNSTYVAENNGYTTLQPIPERDLMWKTGEYGYFYVKNGQVQAIHLLDYYESIASNVSTGRIQSISSAQITVKDISRWENSAWKQMGYTQTVNISKALIIRDGKVIEPKDLNSNNRIIMITTNTNYYGQSHVIIVNE